MEHVRSYIFTTHPLLLALSARDKKASQKLLNEVLKIELGKHFQPADEDAN